MSSPREDEEFPEWWYSPARVDVVQERPPSKDDVLERPPPSKDDVLERPPPSKDDVLERPPSSDDVLERPPSSETVVLRPQTPRNPAPREGGLGRPVIQDGTVQDGSVRDGSPEDVVLRRQDGFTQDELDLLSSKGVVRSPQGEFINRILEKNEFTSKGVIRRERAQENDHPNKPSFGATASE